MIRLQFVGEGGSGRTFVIADPHFV